MKVGDWVMAIGNPFGLGGSVTVGIISAKQRDINAGPYDDFLQTDAAINKGNSGGPLFNMEGEVIGVNTAIISPDGRLDRHRLRGALRHRACRHRSAARVRRDAPRLARRQDPVHHRGYRRGLGVQENTGALVAGVTPDSPAAKAGIQAGDVILKFDGKDVTTMRGLPRLVAQTPIGKTSTSRCCARARERRSRSPSASSRRSGQGSGQGRSQGQGPQGKDSGKDGSRSRRPRRGGHR